MASQLDTAILLGKETTYGTPVALTDAFEGKADSWKRETEYLDSTGFRGGRQAKSADRRIPINMGGTGTLEIDVLTKGFGFLLQSMLGAVTGPAQQASTAAYLQTHVTDAAGPSESYTVQVQRVGVESGTVQSFTHHGAVITGWSLSQDNSGLLVASMNFDFEDVDTATGDGTPAYPASAVPFDWTQAVVTVDGSNVEANSFSLDAELGMKTDRRFLRGSALKKQPVRASVPTFTGAIESEFRDTDLYDLYVSGEAVEITCTWTGANIEGAYDYELSVTLPACVITSDSPEANIDDVAMQPVTFEALDDGSNDVVTITYTTTDTSL